jgi:hypothetical protein
MDADDLFLIDDTRELIEIDDDATLTRFNLIEDFFKCLSARRIQFF